MTTNLKAIARLFRNTRKSKRLSLREVAEHVGLTYAHISRLERGEREIQFAHLDPFCEVLALPRWLPRALLLVDILDGLTETERQAVLVSVAMPGAIEGFSPGV